MAKFSKMFCEKKIPCQHCHIKEQYTEWWERFDQQAQYWTETQYKNSMF
jgi:hypothetical protein